MYNSTIVESCFDHPKKHLQAAVELGFHSLNTIADLLANQAKPLEPTQCEAVGQLIKEMNMLTFLAYEKTVKH
jgi:hypothetical protein